MVLAGRLRSIIRQCNAAVIKTDGFGHIYKRDFRGETERWRSECVDAATITSLARGTDSAVQAANLVNTAGVHRECAVAEQAGCWLCIVPPIGFDALSDTRSHRLGTRPRDLAF